MWIALAAGAVRAQDAPLPSGVALSIERCDALPFDVEAYTRALEVELAVLNAQPVAPGVTRELSVRAPSCGDELEVRLRVRESQATETLRASDFQGVGQARALALATIEALRVLAAQLNASLADAPPAEPPPVEPAPAGPAEAGTPIQPVPPPPPATPRPEPGPSAEVYAGGGAGLLGALDWQLQAGAAFAVWRGLWLESELAFGRALDSTDLGELDASALTLSIALELRVDVSGPLQLSFGAGVRGGAAWASATSERPLEAGRSAEDALAPIVLAQLELGATLELAAGATLGLYVEPGYGLVSARFAGASAADVGVPALAGEPAPQVELLGPSLYAGLTLGYRF